MNKYKAIFFLLLLFLFSGWFFGRKIYDHNFVINEITSLIKKNHAEEVDNKKIAVNIAKGLLNNLDDYSAFLDESTYNDNITNLDGKFGGIGVTISKKDGKLIIIGLVLDSPALNSGVKRGDIIISVDGRKIDEFDNYYDLVNAIRGEVGTVVKMSFFRPSESSFREFNIPRKEIIIPNVKHKIIDNILVIGISQFNNLLMKQVLEIIDQYKDDKSIIGCVLDLRNNPGGSLEPALELSELFLKKGQLITEIKGKNSRSLGKFFSRGLFQNIQFDKKIIILINKFSASASEIVTSALRDNNRAVIIGENSFGKVSVQSVIKLDSIPDGAAKLTIGYYYPPNGILFNKKGVIPDIILPSRDSFIDIFDSIKKIKNDKSLQISIKLLHKENNILFNEIALSKRIEEIVDNKTKYYLEKIN
jgi:carboxyl-terminal processing protease